MSNSKQITRKKKPNILNLFVDAIKSDGSIDGRSAFGRSLAAIRSELDADLYTTSKEILQDHVSVSLVLQRVIESHLVSHPKLLTGKTDDAEYFIGLLLKLKNETRKSLNDLNTLERKHKAKQGKDAGLHDILGD